VVVYIDLIKKGLFNFFYFLVGFLTLITAISIWGTIVAGIFVVIEKAFSLISGLIPLSGQSVVLVIITVLFALFFVYQLTEMGRDVIKGIKKLKRSGL
jgi:uncharacterized membrane protein